MVFDAINANETILNLNIKSVKWNQIEMKSVWAELSIAQCSTEFNKIGAYEKC